VWGDTRAPCFHYLLEVGHDDGPRLRGLVERLAALEELADYPQLTPLADVPDIGTGVSLGHPGEVFQTYGGVDVDGGGVVLEHGYPALEVRERDVDALLESPEEGPVQSPGLVGRPDGVQMRMLPLVLDAIHLLEELVPHPDLASHLV